MKRFTNYKVLSFVLFILIVVVAVCWGLDLFKPNKIVSYTTLVDEQIRTKTSNEYQIEFLKDEITQLNQQKSSLSKHINRMNMLKYDSTEIYQSVEADKVGVFQRLLSNDLDIDSKFEALSFDNSMDYFIANIYDRNIRSIDSPTRKSFEEFRFKVKADLETEITNSTNEINLKEKEIESKEEENEILNEKIKNISNLSSNSILIKYAIPIFALTLIFLLLVPLLYQRGSVQHLIFGKGMLTELITVFLLIASILILGIGGLVKQEVLGTLLGGISVYVLQRSGTKRSSKENQHTNGNQTDNNTNTPV